MFQGKSQSGAGPVGHGAAAFFLFPLLVFPLLSGPLATQAVGSSHVVGWVSSPMLPASGAIHIQDVDNGCQPAKRLCTNVLLNNPNLQAGGTAYDPRHQSVWVSDGRALEERELVSCKSICSAKASIMRTGAVISGLAISSRRQMLYHLETMKGYLGILPWSNTACPPTPTKGGCSMQLGSQSFAGGLAYDEVRDLLYYTVSTPGVTGPTTTLYVARPTSGCNPICSVRLPVCGTSLMLGMVSGLAYDPCKDRLHATDGQTTMSLQVVDPLKCSFKLLGCCAKQTGGGLYQGLAVVPGWSKRGVGQGCQTKGCPYCISLRVGLYGGDPALGNPDFGIQLTGGPTGGIATLAIGLGACTKGVSFLCGTLYLPPTPPPLIVPLGAMTGSTQCASSSKLPLPLPVDPRLCGMRICLQSLVLCGPSGVAFILSPGFEFQLAG